MARQSWRSAQCLTHHTESQEDERLQDSHGEALTWQVKRARRKFRKEIIESEKVKRKRHTLNRKERFGERCTHHLVSGISIPARPES